jgi:hypothetical protein
MSLVVRSPGAAGPARRPWSIRPAAVVGVFASGLVVAGCSESPAQVEPTATRPAATITTPSTAPPSTGSTPTVTATVSAPAPVTVTTTVTASPPSTPLTPNGARLAMNQTATFQHFDVTVDSPSVTEGGGYTVHAEVCVRSLPPNPTNGTTRISWDPWKLVTPTRSVSPTADSSTASSAPAWAFPPGANYKVGECARGTLPFFTFLEAKPREVSYRNSLGDSAFWRIL